jgi:hypothetical protein
VKWAITIPSSAHRSALDPYPGLDAATGPYTLI